jgi:hypothetical protein
MSAVGVDHLLLAVDPRGPIANVQFDAVLVIPVQPGEHQLLGVAMGEECGQPHAVVRGPRLFAERHDAKAALDVELHQLFAKAVSHHAIADDDDRLLLRGCWLIDHVNSPASIVKKSAKCRVRCADQLLR